MSKSKSPDSKSRSDNKDRDRRRSRSPRGHGRKVTKLKNTDTSETIDIDKTVNKSKPSKPMRQRYEDGQKKADNYRRDDDYKKSDDKRTDDYKKSDDNKRTDDYKKADDYKRGDDYKGADDHKKTDNHKRVDDYKEADDCKKVDNYKRGDEYKKADDYKRIDERPRDNASYKRYWDEQHQDKNKRLKSNTSNYKVGSRYYDDPKKAKSGESDRSNKKDEAPSQPTRPKKEFDMLTSRTGGAYIPPAKLRMMQAEITDKASAAYQRISWEALKKSIHGFINKINTGNIGTIIKELLRENIVRGRGLLCRSIIQAQAASPTFTHVYAALVSAINSRFPNIGELLLKRLVIQFKRGFKRNDKSICISAATFVAHLVNQRVAHEILALEILTLLVESPTDDSVEVAIAFLKESGQKLTEVSAKGVNAIFEMLRNILHEGQLDKRVQYMIEVMFQVRKDGFKDHVAVIEELELVPEEDQFTHLIMLDEVTDPQDLLSMNCFLK